MYLVLYISPVYNTSEHGVLQSRYIVYTLHRNSYSKRILPFNPSCTIIPSCRGLDEEVVVLSTRVYFTPLKHDRPIHSSLQSSLKHTVLDIPKH